MPIDIKLSYIGKFSFFLFTAMTAYIDTKITDDFFFYTYNETHKYERLGYILHSIEKKEKLNGQGNYYIRRKKKQR
jgi:hypothetical protein